MKPGVWECPCLRLNREPAAHCSRCGRFRQELAGTRPPGWLEAGLTRLAAEYAPELADPVALWREDPDRFLRVVEARLFR